MIAQNRYGWGLWMRACGMLLALNAGVRAGEWVGQPWWDVKTMRAWAASEYNTNQGALQTVAGTAGTLSGDVHGNDSSGAGMWRSGFGGGGGSSNPSPSGSVGKSWIAYDLGITHRIDSMRVWNYNQANETDRGLRNVTIQFSEDNVHWQSLGDFEFARASGTAGMVYNSEINFGSAKARFVVITAKTTGGNWGDSLYYGLSEIRFYGRSSGVAVLPDPADGAGCADISTVFQWTADPNIVSYDVYFGTDRNQVINAGRLGGDVNGDGETDFSDIAVFAGQWLNSSGVPFTVDLVKDGKADFDDFCNIAADFGKEGDATFRGTVDVNSFDPGVLGLNTNYYWRIDRVADDCIYRGMTWHFSTSSRIANAEYYVATDGNDNNPGTIERPFRTLEKARDTLICASMPEGGTNVYLRGGKYFRNAEFEVLAYNSGKPGKTITYRSYPGENVRIIGGVELQASWFEHVASSSAAWSRLRTLARSSVYQCDLGSHGITDYGSFVDNFNRPDLSFNGQIMTIARWPNSGYSNVVSAQSTTQFTYSGTQPEMWGTEPERFAGGYFYYGWQYSYNAIAGIDSASKTITLASAPPYGIQGGMTWCGLNMLCELDSPGEWYLERSTGILYFWPPSDISTAEIIFSTLGTVNKSLVETNGASDIVFRDITFEMSRFRPIQVLWGRNVCIDNCCILNIGEYGIAIQGGENHTVQNCEIHHTGGAGIYASGGDRLSLTASGHRVRNNTIYGIGRWQRIFTPGIWLAGVGVKAEHNVIYNAPHFGIYYEGNNHVIQLNEIYNTCYETDDAGVIYSGRDWGYRGNVVKHNLIRNISSLQPASVGLSGVYLDDCYSSADVIGNIFYNISGRAILLGGGRDNLFENNIFAKCSSVIFADKRGLTWALIGDPAQPTWDLLGKIEAMNYTQPPWSIAYPSLAAILDAGWEQAKAPLGNKVRKNIGWSNGGWTQGDGISYIAFENNVTNQNPLFVDEAAMNLALRDDSPAYAIAGFGRIPFEAIGIVATTKATRPNPSAGKTVSGGHVNLYWAPVLDGVERDIYFGSDSGAVANASIESQMGVYRGRQGNASFAAGLLGAGTYYWRVDEIDSAGNVMAKGDVWSFTIN